MSNVEENFVSERLEGKEQYGSVPRWLLKLKPSSHAIRIYVYLDATFGNSARGIFPGQELLAEDNDLSRSTIQRALQELQEVGALKVTRRGQGRTNLYKLVWHNPAKPAAVAARLTRQSFTNNNKRQPVKTCKPANRSVISKQEVKMADPVELERQRAKRAEDERRRAQEEADRDARQAERDQWRLDGALEGLEL